MAGSDWRRCSPAALAYLGDAIYSLLVRERAVWPPRADYHDYSVRWVCAPAQAALLAQVLPHLTQAELAVVQWGRNGAGRTPRRVAAAIYQQASALETLLGYLYLDDRERLDTLLQLLRRLMDEASPLTTP